MTKKEKKEAAAVGTTLLLLAGGLMAVTAFKSKNEEGKGGLNSDFYDIDDLTRSATAKKKGIKEQFQQPNAQTIANANLYLQHILNPLADKLGKVYADSWYRHPKLNAAVGGVDDSLHLDAWATDLIYKKAGITDNKTLVKAILLMDIPFHKLILSGKPSNPSIVHVSWRPQDRANQTYLKDSNGKYTPVSKNYVLNLLK